MKYGWDFQDTNIYLVGIQEREKKEKERGIIGEKKIPS